MINSIKEMNTNTYMLHNVNVAGVRLLSLANSLVAY